MRWCPDGDFLAIFLRPVFAASRAQHVSDLHSKFTLGPHHVPKYGRHPICAAEIRRGKKEEDRRKMKETTKQKYNDPLLHMAAIKKERRQKEETTGQKYNGPLLCRAAIKSSYLA